MMYSVTDFDADPTGQTLCTQAIQTALDTAGQAGGGTVLVPPGTYLTGTLQLRSHVKFEIMGGAMLLGSPNRDDYTPQYKHIQRRGVNVPGAERRHLILADDVKDVTLCGSGTICGNDEAFWDMDNVRPSGWIPAKPGRVSNMVHFVDCRDIRIEGVTLTRSPEWTLHLLDCDRVKIHGIRIINNFYGPNNDGIDITGCHDVLISDCDIDTSDDAIVLKTFPHSRTCERICVTNCTFRTNCVAVKVGTETWKDIRGFTIQNCIVRESTRAFGLYCHRGGIIEDVIISNIIFDSENEWELNRPIQLDLNNRNDGNEWGKGPMGKLRNVQISNFICRSDGRILMTARDGAKMENISLSNVQLYYPGKIDNPMPRGLDASSEQWPHHAEGRVAMAAVVAENIDNLRIRDLEIDWPNMGDVPPFHSLWCRNVSGGKLLGPVPLSSHPGHEAVHLIDTEMDFDAK